MAAKQADQPKNSKTASKDYVYATGRRKEAVARVRLYEFVRDGLSWGQKEVKKGDILVNEKLIAEYFPGEINRFKYTEPLRVANAQNKYTITARVVGGGPSGQLDAVVAGIANALVKADPEQFRSLLKIKGFLTRDARIRERRMVGTGGKSRRKKQSPKR
jgi:small subunit ribosomal protein S9